MLDNIKKIQELGKQMNILFVEDNEEVRIQLEKLLSNFFTNINISNDGYEALIRYKEYYKINKKYYDLVITDLNLPKLHGFELCQEILSLNRKQDILVISAHTENDKLKRLVEIGIENFLQKPIDYKHFLNTIYNIVTKK